ncbi:hypothetical protein [Pontibacter cellulosilyticus]|uniref:Uncharacterized protein n=1 Tax=Pontibacter cellulosilyticus TaxID=1720253 RepID=A0A923SI15_9BACT|nr:hypothetical protein [Pontibacter cellulosilyticus]MBC5992273.1 hypothetical protein [Pontibacter cellulosilyticus]
MKMIKKSMQTSKLAIGPFLLFLLAICTAFTVVSCQNDSDHEVSPDLDARAETLVVKIGEVTEEEGLFFLAPIVESASYSGTFDASLSPVVEICATPACEPPLHTLFTVDGSGAEKVRIDMENEHYIVNWNTKESGAVAGQTYRVSVKVEEQIMGYFDVAVVSTGAQAKAVAPGVMALVAGQTLPIKFRIEKNDDGVQVPGRDIVVFNDVNIFSDLSMANPNNIRLIDNLVNFTTAGPRNSGTEVWFDCGHNTAYNGGCSGSVNSTTFNVLRSRIQSHGLTLTNVSSSVGTLINIPSNVKTLFLWLPTLSYTVAEVNALKQFAAEGGRIVFIGEHEGFYTATGLTVENELLISLGAVLRNTGGAVDCGLNVLPTASIRQHPITEGITDLTMACASVIEPGPDDYALFYDKSNTRVLAGVAKIDVTPIAAELVVSSSRMMMMSQPADENLNAGSTTGR